MENIIFAVLVLGAIAIVFGLILSVAAKVFEVKVDERLPKIQECLAGANCGGCGYPGCAGCAEAILAGKAPVTACAPAGAEGAAKIAAIMGMEAPSGEKMVAHVICNGGDAAVKNFEYVGIADCVGALKVAGGPTACSFGCLGFGSCVAACQFDALHINDKGVAEVDKEKCTNCGACREACPRKLIVEVPYKQKVFVNCANKNKGPAVTKVCANSCIACGMCERTCKFDAIHVVNNVAVIDYTKCRNCTMCAKACPKNAIEPIPTPEEKEKFKAAQKAMAEKKAAAAKAAAEAAAAAKAPAGEKKETVDANAPLDFEKIAASIPAIKIRDDLDAHYKQRDPESPKFVTIGERIHCISPVIREAMATFNPDPILERAAQQIKAGATYLDVNIGPAESNGPELMTWAVKLLQENFNNVPLALDTANKKAIEAGIKVYNRTNGKPIVNSADAGSRISYIDLAAANDAICIALCSADGIAKDNDERMMHCHHMLERGMSLGMEATDLWFDPLFLVVKGMQDKQMDVLNAIKLFSDEGLKSTGGLSNNSNGAPKNVRPIMDSALVAMAMMQGLTSAIVNPNDLRLMETIKSCDIFKNNELYSDSYLDA